MSKLLPHQLDRFATGIFDSEILDGAWRGHRHWKSLRKAIGLDKPESTICPTGVRLRFKTDATRIDAKLNFGKRVRKKNRVAVVATQDGNSSIRAVAPEEVSGVWEGAIFEQSAHRTCQVDVWLAHMCECDVLELNFDDAEPPQPLPALPLKWLAFGDSITHGMESLLATETLVGRCALALDAELFNAAIGGGCIERVLAAEFPQRRVDLVSVAYGANDFYHGRSLDEYVGNTRSLIEACQKNSPGTAIVVITPLTDMKPGKKYSLGVTINAYRDALKVLAQIEGVFIVDGETLIPQNRTYFVDDVHPNALGFEQYANGLLPHMKEALQFKKQGKN